MNKHLKTLKMTYFQHFVFALQLAVESLLTAVVLVIHSVFPCLFTDYFSNWIEACRIRLKR